MRGFLQDAHDFVGPSDNFFGYPFWVAAAATLGIVVGRQLVSTFPRNAACWSTVSLMCAKLSGSELNQLKSPLKTSCALRSSNATICVSRSKASVFPYNPPAM
jgi:hypothetical protein